MLGKIGLGKIGVETGSARIDDLLPGTCHSAITDSTTARRVIDVRSAGLIFPEGKADQPLHQIGHQTGNGVMDAAGEQFGALLSGSARQAGILEVSPPAFAGAHLALGRIMNNKIKGAEHRQVLSEFLDTKERHIADVVAPIAVTLSMLEGSELMAQLDQTLKDHAADLESRESVLRPWLLSACPYRQKLHKVYFAGLQHRKVDEVAWVVARLQSLPERVKMATENDKSALQGWVRAFYTQLEGFVTSTNNETVINPLTSKSIGLKAFLSELNKLA
jgi:hypothetical protein